MRIDRTPRAVRVASALRLGRTRSSTITGTRSASWGGGASLGLRTPRRVALDRSAASLYSGGGRAQVLVADQQDENVEQLMGLFEGRGQCRERGRQGARADTRGLARAISTIKLWSARTSRSGRSMRWTRRSRRFPSTAPVARAGRPRRNAGGFRSPRWSGQPGRDVLGVRQRPTRAALSGRLFHRSGGFRT